MTDVHIATEKAQKKPGGNEAEHTTCRPTRKKESHLPHVENCECRVGQQLHSQIAVKSKMARTHKRSDPIQLCGALVSTSRRQDGSISFNTLIKIHQKSACLKSC